MAETSPIITTGKVLEPTTNWEQRGQATLAQLFETLRGQTRRLASASDHYLHSYHSYQKETAPGVSDCLDACVKNTADTFRNTAGDDEILTHMVTSADSLTNHVESQLQVIKHLTEESSRPLDKLSDASKEASELLKQLFESKDLETFNITAKMLTDSLQQEVTNLRNGAASGVAATQEISHLSQEEQDNFGTWWQSNYKEGYYETIPHYQRSLRLFAETAQSRENTYGAETTSIFREVPSNAPGFFHTFVDDYRQSRFPQVQK